MGMANDIRNLTQEILASQEARWAGRAAMKREFRQMASAFKAGLARGEGERRRAFQAMMQHLQAKQRERNREVTDSLTGVRQELQGAASHWRSLASTLARKRAG